MAGKPVEMHRQSVGTTNFMTTDRQCSRCHTKSDLYLVIDGINYLCGNCISAEAEAEASHYQWGEELY